MLELEYVLMLHAFLYVLCHTILHQAETFVRSAKDLMIITIYNVYLKSVVLSIFTDKTNTNIFLIFIK